MGHVKWYYKELWFSYVSAVEMTQLPNVKRRDHWIKIAKERKLKLLKRITNELGTS